MSIINAPKVMKNSRIAFYAIFPFGASFIISQIVDFDYFDIYFKITNLLIFISYILGVAIGRISFSKKKIQTAKISLPIFNILIPAIIFFYIGITLYFTYYLGSSYGWLNLGAYRAFYYDIKNGLIGNIHSLLYICLLFGMFFYMYVERISRAIYVCVLLSVLGFSEGAKASIIFPWIYLFFSYLYVTKNHIRFRLPRILCAIFLFFVVSKNFDFDDVGIFKMVYFYLNNGIYNFVNTVNGDYTPISYHITNFSNIILGLDAPLFNYDKIYLSSFDISSNTASAPATYVSYFGYLGLYFIYFISGFIISYCDFSHSRSIYGSMLVALLGAALFMSFFEEYIINNLLLFFKLCIIYWLFLGIQKLFFNKRNAVNKVPVVLR
jgi:oligosaccharide repeat unit polymerase